MPIDESDPADNVAIIESELFKYSEKLRKKPTWLVFNKIDTMSEEEARQERAKEIVERLGRGRDYYLISAATGQNVPTLTRDIMDFITPNPREVEEENKEADEVKFKWDDYHQEAMQNAIEEDDWDDFDDDWSEEDEEVCRVRLY